MRRYDTPLVLSTLYSIYKAAQASTAPYCTRSVLCIVLYIIHKINLCIVQPWCGPDDQVGCAEHSVGAAFVTRTARPPARRALVRRFDRLPPRIEVTAARLSPIPPRGRFGAHVQPWGRATSEPCVRALPPGGREACDAVTVRPEFRPQEIIPPPNSHDDPTCPLTSST